LGSVPDAPETESEKHTVISNGKNFYDTYSDWVEELEEEIAKLQSNPLRVIV
jgi:hypothetical protein